MPYAPANVGPDPLCPLAFNYFFRSFLFFVVLDKIFFIYNSYRLSYINQAFMIFIILPSEYFNYINN